MALSEESFPPRIVAGEEVPYPGTVTLQPAPTMRKAQLSDEMFPGQNDAGAHYMTPIDTAQPHHRLPGDVPADELYHSAITAQENMAARRDELARRFAKAGHPKLAEVITQHTHERIEESQKNINVLQAAVDAEQARKIGATVVIPE